MKKFISTLFVFLMLLWCTGLAAYVYGIWHMKPYDGNAEGIVVLTGGDGRVEAGLTLLENGHARRMLVSGVHPDVKISELLTMNGHDKALAAQIDLGFMAQDTFGNADETAAWIEKHRIESMIIVTAHYHMPRALLHLGVQLPEVALYTHPVRPKMFQPKDWYKNTAALRLIIGDYNKFLATYPQIIFLKHI